MRQGLPPIQIIPEYLQLLGMTGEKKTNKIDPGFNRVRIELR